MSTEFALLALILVFMQWIEVFVNWLNVNHLNPVLPPEFSDVYDSVRYARSQKYLKVNTKFSGWVGFFDLVIILCFTALGGFNLVDSFVRSFGFSGIVTGILFFWVSLVFKIAIFINSRGHFYFWYRVAIWL
jgi:STE24 endopeptidase